MVLDDCGPACILNRQKMQMRTDVVRFYAAAAFKVIYFHDCTICPFTLSDICQHRLVLSHSQVHDGRWQIRDQRSKRCTGGKRR